MRPSHMKEGFTSEELLPIIIKLSEFPVCPPAMDLGQRTARAPQSALGLTLDEISGLVE